MRQYEKGLAEADVHLNLIGSIELNAMHYIDIFARAVDKIMPKETQEVS